MSTSKRKSSTFQIAGDHYLRLQNMQPWEVLQHWLTKEEYRGYMKGTVLAYLAREKYKGGDVDILKANHTLCKLVETLCLEETSK